MRDQVVLIGASSMIGQPLSTLLQDKGITPLEVARKKRQQQNPLVLWDMETQKLKSSELFQHLISQEKSILIHCAPIWLIAKHIPDLAASGVKRLIVFSSTSIDGKSSSSSEKEQNIVTLLKQSEELVKTYCHQGGVELTIFRPTMIYGYGQGQNLAFIAKCIQRFGIFPIVTKANGLRQPVHINDLANAACLALNNTDTYGKTYNLSGAESFQYDEMVDRIFDVLGKRRCVLKLPLPMYRQALNVIAHSASIAGKTLPVDPSMADRMRQNLDFDNRSAMNDFSFKPSKFLPNGKEDLLP